jgi:hypothetical protein
MPHFQRLASLFSWAPPTLHLWHLEQWP